MLKKMLASLSLLLASSLVFAQNGKPTMEQTIDYIQANHPKNIEYVLTYNHENRIFMNAGGDVTDIYYSFEGSKVGVNFRHVRWDNEVSANGISPRNVVKDENVAVTFDLKDIEKLEAGAYNSIGMIEYAAATEGGGPLFLIFKAVNGKNLIKVNTNGEVKEVSQAWIPFGVDMAGTGHRAMHDAPNTQLFKAFDHLRKLSGAPEPIRF